jgi:Toprim domain-containing protein
MTSAADVARALGGRKAGRGYVAKCPAHQDSNPSLSLADGEWGLLVKCHAGCDSRDVLAKLRQRGLLELAAMASARNAPRPMHEPRNNESDVDRSRRALAIWAEARSLRGTSAWTYLSRRGIDLIGLPENIGEVLRWHPNCPWGERGTRHGCLVALWTEAVTGAPRAIHRRPITAAGEKADRWKALGPTAGCVIRLWSDEIVTHGLVIGEGIETTLAAATRIQHRGTLLTPAWATGDAGHLEKFPVLPGIEALTALVDHDENGRGQRATTECARRWTAAGREVTQLIPRIAGEDFADLVGEPS